MTSEVFILRHETPRQVRIEGLRAIVGFALFAAGATIGLVWAAAAKLVEAVFAFVLYRRPMARLIGGDQKDPIGGAYWESLGLTLAAVAPALLLMLWTHWSPQTPIALVASSILLGGIFWVTALIIRAHPIYLEARRLLQRPRSAPNL